MKRTMAILLAVMMALALAAGCGAAPPAEENSATPDTTAPTDAEREPVDYDIKVLGVEFKNPDMLYRKWNIRQSATIPQPKGDVAGTAEDRQAYADNMLRLFLTEDRPDFMPSFRAPQDQRGCYADLGEQGYLIDFNDYWDLLPEYENTLWGGMEREWAFAKALATASDGGLYALPTRNYLMAKGVILVDDNWLFRLGVEELPEDWADFYSLMLRSLEEDTQSPVVPWTTYEGDRLNIINPVANSYGISVSGDYQWMTMNGEVFWPYCWEEYLYTLREVNRMVDDKLVQADPENPTVIGDKAVLAETWNENLKKGSSFLCYQDHQNCVIAIQRTGVDSGNDVYWGPSEVQPVRKGYANGGELYTPAGYDYVAVGTALGEDFAVRMCRFINYFSSSEGELTYTFGEKDVSYVYNEDHQIELYSPDFHGGCGVGAFQDALKYPYGIDMKENFSAYGEYSIYPNMIWALYPAYRDASEARIRNAAAVYPGIFADPILTAGSAEKADQFRQTEEKLIALAAEFTDKYLNRSWNDGDWDAYIDALQAAGYNDLYEFKTKQLTACLSTRDPHRPTQSAINQKMAENTAE